MFQFVMYDRPYFRGEMVIISDVFSRLLQSSEILLRILKEICNWCWGVGADEIGKRIFITKIYK